MALRYCQKIVGAGLVERCGPGHAGRREAPREFEPPAKVVCHPGRRDQQIRQARHIDRTSATSRSICARVLLTSAFDRSVSHTNVCRPLSSATFFLKYAATLLSARASMQSLAASIMRRSTCEGEPHCLRKASAKA